MEAWLYTTSIYPYVISECTSVIANSVKGQMYFVHDDFLLTCILQKLVTLLAY